MSNQYQSRYQTQKKKERQRVLSFVRYLCPVIWAVLTPLILLFPTLQYTTNQTGIEDPLSGFGLMSNAWQYSRECLFGTEVEQTAGNLQFSRTVLILIALFWVLYAAGAALSVWGLYARVRYTDRDTDAAPGRLWLVTVIPNRWVLCLGTALMLPVSLFHWLMVPLYRTLYVSVSLRILGLDPLWLSLFFFLFGAALSVLTASWERAGGYDIFRKPKEPVAEEGEQTEEEEPLSSYETEARRRRAEEIARLFGNKTDTNDTNDTTENQEHKD